MPTPIQGNIYEDGGASVMARVIGNAGTAITQASLSSISYKVFDLATGETALQSGVLTISAVVFDALQTDARWTADSTGYNFLHACPASWFTDANHQYRIEYKFTPASGEVCWVVALLTTLPLYTS